MPLPKASTEYSVVMGFGLRVGEFVRYLQEAELNLS